MSENLVAPACKHGRMYPICLDCFNELLAERDKIQVELEAYRAKLLISNQERSSIQTEADHWRTLALAARAILQESKIWHLEDGIHKDFWIDKYKDFMQRIDETTAALTPTEEK